MRLNPFGRWAAAGAALALSLGLAAMGPKPQKIAAGPVATDKGLVSGAPSAVADGVMVFKAIPFGAPPVGDLRWKPPQEVAAWEGVRDGTEFSPVCMQPHSTEREPNNPNNRTVDLPGSPPISEDCLYLNVWTPAEDSRAELPVMFWMCPGAYYECGGSTPLYRGDRLAAQGVVVVTMNYRLGPMGFLAHPELTAESPNHASGNYALMDAIAALEWVQANIEAFGGDPDNVTIFGESAGSALVTGLMVSPEAKGLFHKGIAESATYMGLSLGRLNSRERAEAQTLEVAQRELGVTSLADLRALPAEQVSGVTQLRQGMIIDGWIVPEDPTTILVEGRQNAVDMIVGSNADETSFLAFGPPMTAERWTGEASQRWGDAAALGLAAYPAATDAEAAAQSGQAGDDNFAYMMRLFGQWQVEQGKDVYAYYFTHQPPYDEGVPSRGACHTCEIRYVFRNLDAPGIIPDTSSHTIAPTREVDQKVADIMSGYWVNFAKTGDPNGEGLPEWPTLESVAAGPVLHIDDTPAVEQSLSPEKVALYDALFARLRQPAE